jgi:hypothetical protein
MDRFVFALLMLVSTLCPATREDADPLPDGKQIKSLTIHFDHRWLDDVTFTATAADWAAIRRTLSPSRRDTDPANWEWIGTAEFVLDDDEPYRIELYYTSRAPGAFAAGRTFAERVYYRGGDSGDLYEALTAAFEKSAKREVDAARIRRLFRRADKLEIKVAKDAGGFYKRLTLVDAEDEDEIEPLVEHLEFAANAVPRDPGGLGTTVAADITVIRKERALETLQLRGRQIWFGPEHGYQATMKTDGLYRHLRKLVGDPLP